MKEFRDELDKLGKKGLLRSLCELPHAGGKFMKDGKEFLNFSSNDYLNLSNDPRVKKAAMDAVLKFGAGASGSRLMGGTLPVHARLEQELASLLGYEACLLYGSGFLANAGILSSLAKKGGTIFFDRLDHASLIDGTMLGGAAWVRYGHNDLQELESSLKKIKKGMKIIVTESVFSMDGDICPVLELQAVADRNGAYLIIDEAHALGVFGGGGGICAEKNIKPDMITATLSKAMGGYGGVAACSKDARDYLINTSRTFIFSTALPPASAAAGIAAAGIIKNEPGLGKKLLDSAAYFHGLLMGMGFTLNDFSSQIIPVIIGDNDKSVKMAEKLQEQGLYIRAIRPPTVPKGTARLRISVTLAHEKKDLEKAADILGKTAKKEGLL
jgi:8-amino-7-oxononanoate synthase